MAWCGNIVGMPKISAQPVSRRGTQHVRSLILEAARELFAKKGYDGTTTKEISRRSSVSEPVIFGNFGNKATLFNAAVAEPFVAAIERYEESWQRSDETIESRVDRFVRDLFQLARENKVLLLSALLRRTIGNNGDEEGILLDRIATVIQGMQHEPVLKDSARDYQLDTPASIAATAAMVIGVVLLEDMFFARGTRKPGRDRMIAELTSTILHGVTHRSSSRS